MNQCQYCGAGNYADVLQCTKCAAPLPITPAAPVSVLQRAEKLPHDFSVAAERARLVAQSVPAKQKTEPTSLKDLVIYATAAFLVVGLFVGLIYVLNKISPLN